MTKRRRAENEATPNAVETTGEPAQTQAADFFAQLQRLAAADWQSGYKVYIYRLWPIIDRRDEQHYVAKLSEPFDEDVILRNWGSGKYSLRLNDGSGSTICSKTVSLHNLAFPPKVSPDEVVATDPRNERYFKAWPVGAQNGPAPAPANDTAVHELSKLATRVLEQRNSENTNSTAQDTMTSTLVKWALDQTSKERESSDPTRIASLLKELKTLLPQQQPTDGLAMVDRVLSIVEKVNPAPVRTEAQDPLAYVEKALSIADRLRPSSNGSGGGADGGNLASIAAIVHEAAEMLKNPLTIAMQVWAASKVRPNPQTPAAIAPPIPQTHQEPESPMQAVHSRLMAFLLSNIKPMQKHFQDFLTGATRDDGTRADGTDFAYWVWEFHGEEPLKDARTLGSAHILTAFKSLPFWPQIAPYENMLLEFLDQFLKFEPPNGDGDEVEIDERDERATELR